MTITPTILLAAVGIALLLAGFLSLGGALRVVSGGAYGGTGCELLTAGPLDDQLAGGSVS